MKVNTTVTITVDASQIEKLAVVSMTGNSNVIRVYLSRFPMIPQNARHGAKYECDFNILEVKPIL
jgi:hypothetical protein